MKNRKKYFYSLLLLIGIGTVKAQVPGFLGMRNSLGYEGGISMAYSSPNSKFNFSTLGISDRFENGGYYNPKRTFIALNYTHTFIFEHILQRNASFKVTYSILQSGCALREYDLRDNITQTDSRYIGGLTKISGSAVSVTYKQYKNYLCPLGLYYGYFLGSGFSSAPVHTNSLDTTIFSKVHMNTFKLGCVYGRQDVFFNRLIVDRGFSLDLWGILSRHLQFAKLEHGTTQTPAENFQGQIKRRMYDRDIFTFYIGCKFMF